MNLPLLLGALPTLMVGAPAGPEPARPPAARFLVGELLEEGVERCLADYKVEWVNRYHAVGFTPLKPAPGVDPRPFVGQLVCVRGSIDPAGLAPTPPVVHEGECIQMQMRSDWVRGLSGVRLVRDGMGTLSGAFAAEDIRPWAGLEVTKRQDTLRVRLKNTFDVALNDVEVVLHYEGCYGKPDSLSTRRRFPTINPRASVSAEFPTIQRAERRGGPRPHRAYSLQLKSRSGEAVVFDLDWSLRDAGAAVECPDRQRK